MRRGFHTQRLERAEKQLAALGFDQAGELDRRAWAARWQFWQSILSPFPAALQAARTAVAANAWVYQAQWDGRPVDPSPKMTTGIWAVLRDHPAAERCCLRVWDLIDRIDRGDARPEDFNALEAEREAVEPEPVPAVIGEDVPNPPLWNAQDCARSDDADARDTEPLW